MRVKERKKKPDVEAKRTTVTLPAELFWKAQQKQAQEQITTVNEAFATAITQWVQSGVAPPREGARSAIESARKILDAAGPFRNPYQDVVASWRLERTIRQIEGIQSHRLWMKASSADTYLTEILSELLRNSFGPEDEFCTITNLAFWRLAYHDSVETGNSAPGQRYGPYFLAQEEAVAKGLRIHRIFLLETGNGEKQEENERQLEPHKTLLKHVGQQSGAGLRMGSVEVHDLKSAVDTFGHFAFVRRWKETTVASSSSKPTAGDDNGCMVVEPIYDASRRIKALHFIFSDGPGNRDAETRSYIDRFVQAAGMSQDMSKLSE